jgi:hypothetical protein
VFSSPGLTVGNKNRVVNGDFHQAYANELVGGYRRQFKGLIAADIGFVRREYRDRPATIEYNGIYENGVFKGYRDEAFNSLFEVRNNEWNWPVYQALEFSLTKQTRRLQIIASYTRQFRHLAGTWQPSDPASFIQPGAFDTDKSVGRSRTTPNSTADSNSLSGTSMTPDIFQNMWQDHVVRIANNWMAPWGIVVANNYIYQSGPWSGPIITRLAAADPAFGPATLTLSNGRVVANPLATVLRFKYPTRGEGQFVPDAVHVWNMRVGRDFRMAHNRRVEVAMDIYNVPNINKATGFASGHNQDFSANYQKTQGTQAPRTFMSSVRYQF